MIDQKKNKGIGRIFLAILTKKIQVLQRLAIKGTRRVNFETFYTKNTGFREACEERKNKEILTTTISLEIGKYAKSSCISNKF